MAYSGVAAITIGSQVRSSRAPFSTANVTRTDGCCCCFVTCTIRAGWLMLLELYELSKTTFAIHTKAIEDFKGRCCQRT
jgi:hypothetical protein